jgi:hypothetical protein
MRKKVRGLRAIEQAVLNPPPEAAEARALSPVGV